MMRFEFWSANLKSQSGRESSRTVCFARSELSEYHRFLLRGLELDLAVVARFMDNMDTRNLTQVHSLPIISIASQLHRAFLLKRKTRSGLYE